MKRTMKRIVSAMLTLCMLFALAIPAMAFEPAEPTADGSYVYDFEAAMALERNNGAKTSTYGAENASVPESNTIAQSMWNDYYEDGSLNWSYPQVPNTNGNGKTDKSVALNTTSGAMQFYGGDHLLVKFGTDETVAWAILKIKAPKVGVYNVAVEHKTGSNGGVKEGKIHILPAFDLPDAENYDAAAHNAQIDAIVAGGEYALGGTLDCDNNGTASNVVTVMGSVALDAVNAEEYFVIFSADLSKSDTTNGIRMYLQNLTLTPAEEAAVSAGNYSLTNATGISMANGSIEEVAAQYAAGSRDVKVVGLHSGITKADIGSQMFNFGYTMYSAKDPKWVALQVRIPADGSYNVAVNSGTANGTTDPRTGAPMGAYLVKASEVSGTDYAALITEDNKIGSAAFGTGNTRGDYGVHALEKGEYILVLQAENCASGKWTAAEGDHANNFYLKSLEFNPKGAEINGVVYDTVAAAIAVAQEADTVKLMKDYVGDIDLPAGVSLDLNGYDWTVSEYVASNAYEYIFDNTTEGVLKVGSMTLYGDNNGFMPLYDETAGGYRFYMLSISVTETDYETVGDATRFWFKVDFMQYDAIELIKSGKSGLTFGVDVTCGEQTLDVTFDSGAGTEAFAAAWATAYETGTNVWLYADISGLDALTETLTVTPTVEIAGNDLSGGSLVKNVG